MIHYHGLPIGSQTVAMEAVGNGHAFISFRARDQLPIAMEVCQSFAVDNGAFSAWKVGHPIKDWSPFYAWVESICRHPGFDWAIVPDVIDGDEEANDALLGDWPLSKTLGVPVWHMHESFDRLVRLCSEWPRVCIGSSGSFSTVGSADWWVRIHDAMRHICDPQGRPMAKLHGLRMLNPKVFSKLPFASADSTNIGRNVGIDSAWKGTYLPPTKEARARVMRQRIESFNSSSHWTDPLKQPE